MGENIHKSSTYCGMDSPCVLALEAPNKPGSSAKPPRPGRRKILVADEPNNKGWRVDSLRISQGEDIGEKVLSFFQKSTNNSVSSHGRARMGFIMSATGSVLDPSMNTESWSASYKGSFPIMNLGGMYIISGDGQVQQHGPLTILSFCPCVHAIGGRVNGRLVSEGHVEVRVGSFYTEGELKV